MHYNNNQQNKITWVQIENNKLYVWLIIFTCKKINQSQSELQFLSTAHYLLYRLTLNEGSFINNKTKVYYYLGFTKNLILFA